MKGIFQEVGRVCYHALKICSDRTRDPTFARERVPRIPGMKMTCFLKSKYYTKSQKVPVQKALKMRHIPPQSLTCLIRRHSVEKNKVQKYTSSNSSSRLAFNSHSPTLLSRVVERFFLLVPHGHKGLVIHYLVLCLPLCRGVEYSCKL